MTLNPQMAGELRGMVRDLLREVMAGRSTADTNAVETVRLTSDAELSAFVARLIDPATLERVRSGRLRFKLQVGPAPAVTAAASAPRAEVLTGVVTEQKIDRLAGTGTLVLAAGAVLTPLARDKARRLGLKVERKP